jgi:phosphoglycerate dehydrogenase-like enzyme
LLPLFDFVRPEVIDVMLRKATELHDRTFWAKQTHKPVCVEARFQASRRSSPERVIGLGNIGGGVARNLSRAGYTVRAADLDPHKVDAVVHEGGIAADSAIDAATGADVAPAPLAVGAE